MKKRMDDEFSVLLNWYAESQKTFAGKYPPSNC
jgi:hypothetical protein